jgi:hypothetical protein
MRVVTGEHVLACSLDAYYATCTRRQPASGHFGIVTSTNNTILYIIIRR